MAAELFGVALEMRILAAENDMAGDEEVGLGKGRERRWWWMRRVLLQPLPESRGPGGFVRVLLGLCLLKRWRRER